MPTVSILVPIYGVEKYIEQCAETLFQQSFADIEYVFVNDCTKDRSVEILQQTIDRFPERKSQVILIQHEHNKGLGGARHTAFAAREADTSCMWTATIFCHSMQWKSW